MSVRTAGAADAAAVTALVRAAYAKWVPLIGREPLPMQADYAAAVREHTIDLMYDGEDLVGLIETIPHADHLFIENVAVAPTQQGRGFGRQLLALAEDKARFCGLFELRLLTNAAFTANIRLYERLGYRIDRREERLGGVTVHMSKRI